MMETLSTEFQGKIHLSNRLRCSIHRYCSEISMANNEKHVNKIGYECEWRKMNEKENQWCDSCAQHKMANVHYQIVKNRWPSVSVCGVFCARLRKVEKRRRRPAGVTVRFRRWKEKKNMLKGIISRHSMVGENNQFFLAVFHCAIAGVAVWCYFHQRFALELEWAHLWLRRMATFLFAMQCNLANGKIIEVSGR